MRAGKCRLVYVRFAPPHGLARRVPDAVLPRDGSATLLDIRTEGEYRRGHLEGFRNIPLDFLRAHLAELDPEKPVFVNCQTGLRSYLACRILAQHGFSCAHLSGGYSFYRAITAEQLAQSAYPCGMGAPEREICCKSGDIWYT